MTAGAKYGITPYGTEAMHVLRAEKGFIIVGQDTDGSLNPHDMDMSWIIGKDKDDFIGKRSLTRKDMSDPMRKQYVGILTDDPKEVLPEGAQLVNVADAPASAAPKSPVPMQGTRVVVLLVVGGGALDCAWVSSRAVSRGKAKRWWCLCRTVATSK